MIALIILVFIAICIFCIICNYCFDDNDPDQDYYNSQN